jgi:flagellum-specific peptidoglycan hydrolase FlgJ
MLRSAIVNAASYYLSMAEGKTPAEMEAMIWHHDSIDGAGHGAWCAAFASLTLELAANVVGQQSWVTGGTSYPWPLHQWADVRVDPNPGSSGVISVRQDAKAHRRWHPLGDGYEPQPGDWVLFDGHVEVVTEYAGGVLRTVGGDSLPDFSVNAHEYGDPLGAQGVAGFVNNGALPGTVSTTPHAREHVPGGHRATDKADAGQTAIPGAPAPGSAQAELAPPAGGVAIPGLPAPAPSRSKDRQPARRQAGPGPARSSRGSQPAGQARPGAAVIAGLPGAGPTWPPGKPRAAAPAAAAIPGLPPAAHRLSAGSTARPATPYRRHHQPSPLATPVHGTSAEQAFIGEIAPGAVAAQRRYGVPASVTIAQAIVESGWGRSHLASRDHNLFGIKGTGPAGRDLHPAQEYENGQTVTRTNSFRVYHSAAESIDDHGRHLATSKYYKQAMAGRQDPDSFAAALTGIYATDPEYGTKLIDLMRRYDLYHYDIAAPASAPHAATPAGATIPGLPNAAPAPPASTPPASPPPSASPSPTAKRAPRSQTGTHQPPSTAMPSTQTVSAKRMPAPGSRQTGKTGSRQARPPATQYQQHIPPSVRNAFTAVARVPLLRAEPLYRDVASHSGIRWELLAACDWMQCAAQPRYSPVHGEKLGTLNPGGTIYRTKSEALEQCADDLAELAHAVYRIGLAAQGDLSVRDLANVFAAFRWGGLLKAHRTSAMEFPYSVAGLTAQHVKMRWPNIDDPNTPDKPGGRFRMPFGAVPIVLFLNYPATV